MKKGSRLAIVDHLTNLYNRRYFDITFKELILKAKKQKQQFSLLMLDIDNFKMVNDKFGHFEGDKVLLELAKILKASMRRGDICFRYGGDEVAIILPDTGKETAETIRERIKNKIEQHTFAVEDEDNLPLRLSIGIAVFPEDGLTSEVLIKKADEALYEDKRIKRRQKEEIVEPAFVLKTKLHPPVLKENTIPRSRLISLIKENLSKKLVLIVADAGYGKTTLLTQVINGQKLPCVFYDLDGNDSDLAVFLSYLVYGLEQIHADLILRTKEILLLGGEVVHNYELLMGTLINELIEKRRQELFFIFDDYHTVSEGSLVHRALDYLIDHLPETIHVVIASRVVPSFASLAKWRSKQDLFELSREGLRFTEEEVKTLLNEVYKIALPEEELRRVSEKTEGWITGIQLILQSARKDGKVPAEAGIKETLNGYLEANQPLFEYFANEIYIAESKEIQNFLKNSSILDIMTPGVCDFVFAATNSEQLLKTIAQHNLFVYTVGKNEYKYHRLFRDFLKDQTSDEGSRKALHLRAAEYYQHKKQMEQAIEQCLRAKSHNRAAQMIIQISNEMRKQARFAILKTWLDQIPKEVFQEMPCLLLLLGRLNYEQGLPEQAQDLYEEAEEIFNNLKDTLGLVEVWLSRSKLLVERDACADALKALRQALRKCPASEAKIRIKILNAIGITLLDKGELNKAKSYLRRAYVLCKRASSHQTLVAVGSNLAVLAAKQGKMQEAFVQYEKAIEQIGESYHYRIGVIFANAALAALELGKIDWAKNCLDKGWNLCQPYEDAYSRASLSRVYGVLCVDRNLWEQALQYFQKALDEFAKMKLPVMETLLYLDLARFYRCWGDLEKAQMHLAQAKQRTGKKESSFAISILVEQSLLQVSLGQSKQAEQTTKTILRLTRKHGLKNREFDAWLAYVEVNLLQEKNNQAIRFFQRAIHLARRNGYDGILARKLQLRPRLFDLAQRITRSTLMEKQALEYVRGILAKCTVLKFSIEGARLMKVQLFGKFELLINNIPQTAKMKRQTTKAILAYFFLHPKKSVSWQDIALWVWPDSPGSSAHQMFRNAVSDIRKCAFLLKSTIIHKHNRYFLNPDFQGWIDTLEFQELLKQASVVTEETKKINLLESAAALYQGPLLQEYYYPWIDNMRRVYEVACTKAIGSLADIYFHRQEYEKSVSLSLRLLEVDDSDEAIHRLVITSYLRLGLKSKAVEHYEHLKKNLRTTIGLEPSPETIALMKSFA